MRSNDSAVSAALLNPVDIVLGEKSLDADNVIVGHHAGPPGRTAVRINAQSTSRLARFRRLEDVELFLGQGDRGLHPRQSGGEGGLDSVDFHLTRRRNFSNSGRLLRRPDGRSKTLSGSG